VVRADSTFYTADVAATAIRYGADVSLTTGSNPSVNAAIARIPDTAWTAIHYPNAFMDTETGELVSDAEVADIGYTAFTSHPKRQQVEGRLTVRRVTHLNPEAAAGSTDCSMSGGITPCSSPVRSRCCRSSPCTTITP
jgi:hypothetical protein